MSLGIIDLSSIPTSREGFYATNNRFQKSGPKGYIEVKALENGDIYVRVDMAGVATTGLQHRIDGVRRKVVFFSGEAPKEEHDEVGRSYSGVAGLGCDCCEITGVDAKMENGVLRMVLSRVKVVESESETKCCQTVPPCGPLSSGRSGRHLEPHPYVVNGSKDEFEYKLLLENKVCYTRFDLPGASPDNIEVFTHEDHKGEYRFYCKTEKVTEHDESGRVYLGSLESPTHLKSSKIDFQWTLTDGVLRTFITGRADK